MVSQPRSERRGGGRQGDRIDLLKTVELLQSCLTGAVCKSVFQQTRTTERVREWTLKHLADFWTAVILRGPESLTGALQEAQEGMGTGWPTVPATSKQGFFERCKDLRWEFFDNLYRAFRDQLVQASEPVFCSEIAALRDRFPEIWCIDGSRLDAIAHRLKILWDVRSPILPGCVEACYDLIRGIPRALRFDPDAATAEIARAREILDEVPPGTLLIGDRLYASVEFFNRITKKGVYGLFRRTRGIGLRKVKRLSRRRIAGGILEDWLVEAGCGHKVPVQQLRWIRFRANRVALDSLTNVLDPAKLPADLAWALYPFRWTIERMFYDLKEVLNLHCFYAGNPNAVAMQVYAAAMVYTACRVAQGQAAREAGVAPETISTNKLFPKVASASFTWTIIQLTTRAIAESNPDVSLRLPDWRRRRFAFVALSAVRVERRSEHRRKRRFCASRGQWKSFSHVSGGGAYLGN
jgi:hypothetical protein